MPLSIILKVILPSELTKEEHVTAPHLGVNFMAFVTRFRIICRTARISEIKDGSFWSSIMSNVSLFSSAQFLTYFKVSRTASLNLNSSTCNSNCPASILIRSRISFINSSRWCPVLLMSFTDSQHLSFGSLPYTSCDNASENPRIAFIGVLSSWLILARNSDFAWLV